MNKRKLMSITSMLIAVLLYVAMFSACSANISGEQAISTSVPKVADNIRFERVYNYDEQQELDVEYAIIMGMGSDGAALWTHLTGSYPCGQYDAIEEVVCLDDQYIFCEDGTLTALDMATGEPLWKNDDFGGCGVRCLEEKSGNLYLCAFQGPAFFALDKNGNTLCKIETFEGYDWARDIQMIDDKIAVTMELSLYGEFREEGYVFYVDPVSYSFSLQNPPENLNGTASVNQLIDDSVFIEVGENEAFTKDDALFVLGTNRSREYIRSITFQNSLKDVPIEYTTDVSRAQDGSVLAWLQANEGSETRDLYIAADGNIVAPENCMGLFAGYTNLEAIHFNNCFDTSNVTDMTGMFLGCGVSELDLSGFDTSNVQSMAWMFSHTYLTELDVSSFNTGNVTDMQGMFAWFDCEEGLDVSHFDTSEVADMSNMFEYCVDLRKLDLGAFDTSAVTDMSRMFYRNIELEELNVAGFETSFVTDMESMFYECSKLEKLDVSGFDTRRVTDMSDMFYCCSSLTSLDVSGFKTPAAVNMSGMFSLLNVQYLDLRGFDFSNVEDASYMFFASEELKNVDINQINLPQDANIEMMFEYCPAF